MKRSEQGAESVPYDLDTDANQQKRLLGFGAGRLDGCTNLCTKTSRCRPMKPTVADSRTPNRLILRGPAGDLAAAIVLFRVLRDNFGFAVLNRPMSLNRMSALRFGVFLR
jgi:hypothetical protein